MAKVMVQMLQYIKTEKVNIQESRKAAPVPEVFQRIRTARLTPGKHLPDNHVQLTDNFLQALAAYRQQQDATARKAHFNLLVTSCIACHERACPGPIAVIEQQLLP